MSELAELLKQSVMGLVGPYREALKDLEEETTTASEAVAELTGGRARLLLARQATNQRKLVLVCGSDRHGIGEFKLEESGYPIEARGFDDGYVPGFGESFHNRSEIHEFYSKLANNPKSTFVQRLAFIMRG